MRPVQYFSDAYLERCRSMTPDQIIRFLDDFRQVHGSATSSKSKLISLRIPEHLLSLFKRKAALEGTRYQSKIKELMSEWVS